MRTKGSRGKGWSAVLLAAGYGTRLGELTEECPKALLPVGGRPLLDHLLAWLDGGLRLDRIVLVTNSRHAPQFRRWVENRANPDRRHAPIRLVDNGTRDPAHRLGAVGDLALALERFPPRGSVLVGASDTLVRFDPEGPASLLDRRREAGAVVPVVDEPDPRVLRHRGVVLTDGEGRIIELHEKPEDPPSTLTALPLYFMTRRACGLVSRYLTDGHGADALGGFLAWLVRREVVLAYLAAGGRLDIGTPKGLHRARTLWDRGEWPQVSRGPDHGDPEVQSPDSGLRRGTELS